MTDDNHPAVVMTRGTPDHPDDVVIRINPGFPAFTDNDGPIVAVAVACTHGLYNTRGYCIDPGAAPSDGRTGYYNPRYTRDRQLPREILRRFYIDPDEPATGDERHRPRSDFSTINGLTAAIEPHAHYDNWLDFED